MSKLHQENLLKASKEKEMQSASGIQYRDRAKERRDLYGEDEGPKSIEEENRAKRLRVQKEERERKELLKVRRHSV